MTGIVTSSDEIKYRELVLKGNVHVTSNKASHQFKALSEVYLEAICSLTYRFMEPSPFFQ